MKETTSAMRVSAYCLDCTWRVPDSANESIATSHARSHATDHHHNVDLVATHRTTYFHDDTVERADLPFNTVVDGRRVDA